MHLFSGGCSARGIQSELLNQQTYDEGVFSYPQLENEGTESLRSYRIAQVHTASK